MKINSCLVTGATGFLGKELVSRLRSHGVSITALLKRAVDGPWDRLIVADLSSVLDLDLELKGIDCVFHLAGLAHDTNNSVDEKLYRRVNSEATLELARIAASNGVRNFIYVSSVKAMGQSSAKILTEKSPAQPNDIYGCSKLKAEIDLLELAKSTAMSITILRPSLIYGCGVKGNLLNMLKGIDKGWFPPLPHSQYTKSMVSIDDVVDAMLLAVAKPDAAGKIYILSDGQQYSARTIYNAYRNALGLQERRWSLPMWLFRVAAIIGEGMSQLGLSIPFNQQAWQKLFGSAEYSAEKIQMELGWRPEHTFNSVVPQIVEYYKNSLQSGCRR